MRKTMKKILAFTLAAALTLGTAVTSMAATTSPTVGKVPVTQDNVKTDDSAFTTQTNKKGTIKIKGAKAVSKSKATVPATLTVNGVTYKVTSLGTKSLSNWNKVKTIVLSENVKTIQKSAFQNCKKLRTIIVKNAKPTKFYAKAFKGVNTKKITIKFSKKMSKKNYRKSVKSLKKIGFKGKIKRA